MKKDISAPVFTGPDFLSSLMATVTITGSAVVLSLLFGLLFAIPFPVERGLFTNWAALFLALALVYYLRLTGVLP